MAVDSGFEMHKSSYIRSEGWFTVLIGTKDGRRVVLVIVPSGLVDIDIRHCVCILACRRRRRHATLRSA
jgi:CRP-like cAMP-binding protein